MIKGAKKQMIVVRTGDSRYFDEAYFVLRKEVKEHPRNKNDILSEANRILEESASVPHEKTRSRLIRWLFFLAGSLCGGGLTAGILYLIFL